MFDLHNDFPTVIPRERYAEYLSRCDCTVTAAIFTSEMIAPIAPAVERITAELRATDCPISIEDLGFLGGSAGEFDFGQYFYCSLTWNYDNRFAGGALGIGDLTADGKAVVAAMNDAHCAVDLAHLNKRSFYSALDVARFPICSHTGFSEHPRCLDAEQVRALVSRHAVIGLCAVKKFTRAESANALAEEIDRFVQRYGIDCLGLGTDFNGSTDLPHDFESYADIDNLTYALCSFGYSDGDIRKILFDNANRFYKELKP